jgi:hypothetical protein
VTTVTTLFSLVCERREKGREWDSGRATPHKHEKSANPRHGSSPSSPIVTASHANFAYFNGATRPDRRAVKYVEGNGASKREKSAKREHIPGGAEGGDFRIRDQKLSHLSQLSRLGNLYFACFFSLHRFVHCWEVLISDVTPVQIRFQDEELAALDSYRRDQLNPPSRAKAARELIRRALSERTGGHSEADAAA